MTDGIPPWPREEMACIEDDSESARTIERLERDIVALDAEIRVLRATMRECANELESILDNPSCHIGDYTKEYHIEPIIKKLRGEEV